MSDELPKNLKIFFLVNAVFNFIYMVLYLVIPETFGAMLDVSSYVNEFVIFWVRADGIIVLTFAIFDLLIIKVNNWEKTKLLYEFGMVWLAATIVLNFSGLATLPLTATALSMVLTTTIILCVMLVITIYLYLQQTRG